MPQIRRVVSLSKFIRHLDTLLAEFQSMSESILITRHSRGLFVAQPPDIFAKNIDLADYARLRLWGEKLKNRVRLMSALKLRNGNKVGGTYGTPR